MRLTDADWVTLAEIAHRFGRKALEDVTNVVNSEVCTLVGTCGFAKAQARLFRDFDIVEVQQTFYQPPRVKTVTHWRDNSPEDFVFTLKAWQLLTREPTSPTYRRLKENLSESRLAQAGSFKWNDVTRMAWVRTMEIAEALAAQVIVFQTPPSFTPTQQNLRRRYHFFEQIDRRQVRMVFESRSEAWDDATLRQLVAELDLIHVVEPFLRRPVGRRLHYLRLHGRPAYHYRYRYTDADLLQLQAALSKAWPNWVLFNNDAMADDARRFLKCIR